MMVLGERWALWAEMPAHERAAIDDERLIPVDELASLLRAARTGGLGLGLRPGRRAHHRGRERVA